MINRIDKIDCRMHNNTTGNYGGAFIGPEMIATNIYTLMDRGE